MPQFLEEMENFNVVHQTVDGVSYPHFRKGPHPFALLAQKSLTNITRDIGRVRVREVYFISPEHTLVVFNSLSDPMLRVAPHLVTVRYVLLDAKVGSSDYPDYRELGRAEYVALRDKAYVALGLTPLTF